MSKKNSKTPSRISKPAVTALVLLAAAAAVFLIKTSSLKTGPLSDTPSSRTKGNPKGKIHIVEYVDFQCPACGNGDRILKEYLKKYPSQIRLEVKHYPLSMHPHAMRAALYAECAAAQNRFWSFKDLLFARQKEWGGQENPEEMFQELAKQSNLDLVRLKACTESEATKTSISEERAKGKSRGVNSTPTYFINEKMIVGPKPLQEELNTLLNESSR